jgi:hypothetical protein
MQLLPPRPLVRHCYLHLRKASIHEALLAMLVLACLVVSGRSAGLQGQPEIGAPAPPGPKPSAESEQMEVRRPGSADRPAINLNAFNQDRKKAIAKDSEKLLGLTAALKAELESDPGKIQSDDVAQKIKEIEKLAHKVKDRMLEDPTPSPFLR